MKQKKITKSLFSEMKSVNVREKIICENLQMLEKSKKFLNAEELEALLRIQSNDLKDVSVQDFNFLQNIVMDLPSKKQKKYRIYL